MKKFFVITTALLAAFCGLWYYEGKTRQQAEELIWAAYDGNLTGVKNAIESGAGTAWVLHIDDPARDYRQAAMTPLLAAASGGNEKIIQYLIKQGDDPNQTNDQGWTPLFIATREGHAEAAAQLVLLGADPNLQTNNGASAVIMSVISSFPQEKQRLSLLEYLLKKQANPNLYTRWNTDALYYSVTTHPNPDVTEMLLKYGADPCRTYNGKTLTDLARQNPKAAVLLPLLKKARKHCALAQTKTADNAPAGK